MDLAGDVIQALGVFLKIEDLHVTADFPSDMEDLRNILIRVRLSRDTGGITNMSFT